MAVEIYIGFCICSDAVTRKVLIERTHTHTYMYIYTKLLLIFITSTVGEGGAISSYSLMRRVDSGSNMTKHNIDWTLSDKSDSLEFSLLFPVS